MGKEYKCGKCGTSKIKLITANGKYTGLLWLDNDKGESIMIPQDERITDGNNVYHVVCSKCDEEFYKCAIKYLNSKQ